MTTTTPLPKRFGYKLPLEALGGACIRVTLEFPDKLEYRAAFNGSINMLGKWFQWDHTQADYQEIPELNVEVAQVWSEVLAAATWEECMEFCAHMIACLTTDSDVQNAFSEFISQHPGGTTYPKETTLPPGASAGNILGENPGCDPDILWSQCIGLVQTANRMIEDFLETWETYNNGGEVAGDIIAAIPGLSGVAAVIGVNGIIEYANDLIDSIAENYASDYTLEYEQQLACEIFCAAKDDCVVSIDMLTGIMNARIGNALTLDNLTELLISLIDMDISGFNVADLYLAFFMNALKVANLVIPVTWGIEAYLQAIAIFNTPSDDWEILCEDCPPPPDDWIKDIFTSGNMHSWEAVGAFAAFDNGWTDGSADDIQIGIKKLFSGQTLTAMRVVFDVPFPGTITAQSLGNYNATDFVQMTPDPTYTYWELTGLSRNAGIFLNFVRDGTGGITGHKIVEIWYKVAP